MAGYSKVNLNRNILFDSIEEVAKTVLGDNVVITTDTPSPEKKLINYTFNNSTIVSKLSFYLNSNGTTSITVIGSNQDESKIIADLLYDKSIIDERKTFSFCVPNIKDEDFKFLCNYLINDVKADHDSKIETYYTIHTFSGVQGDSLTIKRYNSGNTQFQGKPISLYKEVCYVLSEICNSHQIIKTQQEFYKIQINNNSLDSIFDNLFPNSKEYLNIKLKDIILPSLTVFTLDIDNLPDYTMFVFPILKGLEGYLKKLFKERGFPILDPVKGFGQYLVPIDGKKLRVHTVCRKAMDLNYCKAIEDAYAFYQEIRNNLFHVDAMVTPTQLTYTQDLAKDLINKTADVIEKSYLLIKN